MGLMSEVRGCSFPDDLLYDSDLNLWFRQVEKDTFEVGITVFGHALSGDLYMFNPKPIGREIEASRAFALVEAAKTVLPVRTPFDAIIVETNPDPQQRPSIINQAPYQAWLVKLRALRCGEANEILLHGDQVAHRARSLMDMFNFESLDTYVKGSAS